MSRGWQAGLIACAAWLLWVPSASAGSVATSIVMTKTVGTDPSVCASSTSLQITLGVDNTVTYCYAVQNTSTFETFTLHNLVDSELGPILNNFSHSLPPGASTFVTQTATLCADTTNVATWTALTAITDTNPASFESSAKVNVTLPTASIAITKTVGTDPDTCGATDQISVPAGSDVVYCYTVQNTGPITLTTHTLQDSVLGTLFSNLSYTLAPGASAFVTDTMPGITLSTVNVATWTADFTDTCGFTSTAVATDSAEVIVETVTPTETATPTATATTTATPTDTATVTETPTETATPSPTSSPTSTPTPSQFENDGGDQFCSDGVDNDLNGLIDCRDPACLTVFPCAGPAPVVSNVGLLAAALILLAVGCLALTLRRPVG